MNDLSAWLRSRSTPVRGFLALTVGLGELAGLLLLAQTALLVRIGNGVIFNHETLASLAPNFWLLIVTILVRAVVAWGSRRSGYAYSGAVKHTLREELVRHIAAVGPIHLAGEHAGETANTVVDAVEALDGYYARYLPQRAIASLLPLTVLAVVFPLDWISGITLLVTAIFIPILMILIGEDAHERNQRLWGTLARMSARFLDTLQGITTLKIFGAARREAAIIEEISEEYRTSTMSVMRIAFVSALMLELISTVSIAIVAIASGLRMLAGHMAFAPGYFILLVAPEYFLTLRNLGTYYHSRMEAVSAAEHITRLLALPTASAATVRPAEAAAGTVAAVEVGARAVPRPETARQAEPALSVVPAFAFLNTGFRYGPDRGRVLEGFDLQVQSGEHLALLGQSGAGKSTIINLLLGFVAPSSGSVELFGRERGADEQPALLERISWLPQRPTIFHGTVAENIALGRAGCSREEIEHAAELAYAHEFIRRLPREYETPLGERGRGLSGGQIQRIALARLFLRDAELVLLDEPTAHLDRASEEMVRASIERLAEGRTLLLVTHRVSSVEALPRIVVLRNGRIAEEGSHQELLRRGGHYLELIENASEEELE